MKISRPKALPTYLPPVLLVLSLLGCYLSALAPGLTWANRGYDGGDLITAAATGGVAHPSGYPLYLLLARLFQLLPVGPLAYRTNLLSAVCTALAAGLVYAILTRTLSPSRPAQGWPAGLVGGLAFGLAPLVWSQAVITEVYGLQATLAVLILYLYTVPVPAPGSAPGRLGLGRGLALGLAMGNHLTTILLLPVAFVLGSHRARPGAEGASPARRSWFGDLKFDLRSLWGQLGGFGLGLCIYLLLPLRALTHPPVNWGNPVTPGRLWWLVSGQLYQGYYLDFSLAGVWERIQAWAGITLEQFGLPGLALGLLGLVVYAPRSRLTAFTAWMAAVSLAFAIFYRSDDSYVYLIPMFLSTAVWIGLGLAGLARALSMRFPSLGAVLGLVVSAYFLGLALVHFSQVDASADLRAEAFGGEVLATVPENALVFAKGDRAVLALWYFHFALHERPDLAVIASDLLHFDWYQETLHATYPSLAIPGPFPWPETMTLANPARPSCTVRYTGQAEIQCAGALTTP